MRSARSEHILLAVLLAVPLAVAFLGWPAFVRWAGGPSTAATPEVAGASATSVPLVSAPTPRPTVGVPPAASLWSPRLRAAFPPAQNIDQRFSQTRALTVQRADVVSQTDARAAVAVDVDETATNGQHHWSGTWQVVRGTEGWLLDQPQLQGR